MIANTSFIANYEEKLNILWLYTHSYIFSQPSIGNSFNFCLPTFNTVNHKKLPAATGSENSISKGPDIATSIMCEQWIAA